MEEEKPSELEWKLLQPNLHVQVLLTVLYAIILTLGVIGNSVTIQAANVLRRKGYLQKNVTDHMVSLACSDLLVLLIGMPVELYSAIWHPFEPHSGDANCKIYTFLFEACSYATLLNVGTMSFERFMAICYPFRYKTLSERHTGLLILFAWLTSVLVAVPLLIAMGTEGWVVESNGTETGTRFCTYQPEHWTMFRASISLAFVLYILVLGLVAFMCRSMIRVIRAAGKGVTKSESAQVKAARKQTIVFLGLIVVALVICWFPNQVRRMMTAVRPLNAWTADYLQSYVTLLPIADTLFYLSSVVNPFLYNLSSRQFRQTFLQVLLCRPEIEHVNRRTVAWSARSSLNPLVKKSRRQKDHTHEDGHMPGSTDATLQDSCKEDSGVVMERSASVEGVAMLRQDSNHLGSSETEI